jgi:hypothetical protein
MASILALDEVVLELVEGEEFEIYTVKVYNAFHICDEGHLSFRDRGFIL